jgi:ATP-dependent Clp protease ATP-binding subunit ClpC
LRRAVVRLIEDSISGEMLEGNIKQGDRIVAEVENGKIVYRKNEENT